MNISWEHLFSYHVHVRKLFFPSIQRSNIFKRYRKDVTAAITTTTEYHNVHMNGFVLCAQQGAQEAQIIAVFILPTTTKNGRKLRMLSAVANYRILRIVFIWDIYRRRITHLWRCCLLMNKKFERSSNNKRNPTQTLYISITLEYLF